VVTKAIITCIFTTAHVFFFSSPDYTPPKYWHITDDKSLPRSGA
jgi:hypothetical protein